MVSNQDAAPNRLKQLRGRRGWTQAELARRANVSRPAVSAIETNRLVPSVTSALKLAACLDCTVEELFGTTSIVTRTEWAWTPHPDGSRYWEATVAGRILLFPCEETAAGELPHDGLALEEGGAFQTSLVSKERHSSLSESDPSRTLIVAGCDPAGGLLAAEYARQTGLRMIVLYRSSGRALRLLSEQRVHVAGVHLSAAGEKQGNAHFVSRALEVPATLLRVARWEEGVAFVPDQQAKTLRSLLQKPLRWIGRESGSGARQCLDELLQRRKSPSRIASDHRGVAMALRDGWADAGVCVRLVSEEARLQFLSVRVENYDLSFLKSTELDPRIQALVRVVRSSAYRRLLAELPGYHVAEMGELESTAR